MSAWRQLRREIAQKEAAPFRIIATDAGFEAPAVVAAGLRHIIFENRGSQIHEAMLVRLAEGMSADDYSAAVKKGALFPEGALDYSDASLTSPGKTAEMWLRVDPGRYIIICWNDGHARTTPVHPLVVEQASVADDRVPKEDLVLRLLDYRFEFEGKLHKGVQVIRIETPGPAMHEVDIYRLDKGDTVAELSQCVKRVALAPRLPKPWAVRSTAMTFAGWCGCERNFPPAATSCIAKCLSQRPASHMLTWEWCGRLRSPSNGRCG